MATRPQHTPSVPDPLPLSIARSHSRSVPLTPPAAREENGLAGPDLKPNNQVQSSLEQPITPAAAPVASQPLPPAEAAIASQVDASTSDDQHELTASDSTQGSSERSHRSNHESPATDLSNIESPVNNAEARTAEKLRKEFPKWPYEGKTLEQDWIDVAFAALVDILLILVPLGFMVVAILGQVLNGRSVASTQWGVSLLTLRSYGVTIYGILFAAVAGRGIKLIATWMAVRGAKIGLLEQLFGSATVTGTLITQYKLRSYDLVAVLLIAIWALSPLGSQAILRMLDTTNTTLTTQASAYYIDSSAYSNTSGFLAPQTPFDDSYLQVYQASLVAPNATQWGPRDIWGNVKIPNIETLNSSTVTSDGWIPVPSGVSYSSLVGMPLANITATGETVLVIPSSYFRLQCPEGPQVLPWNEEIIWGEDGDGGQVAGNSQPIDGFGTSRYQSPYTNLSRTNNYWSIGTFASNNSLDGFRKPSDPMSIYFQFQTVNATEFFTDITVLNCRLTFSTVESQVQCQGLNCQVLSMRRSSSDTTADNASPLDDLYGAYNFFDTFASTTGSSGYITEFNKNSFLIQYLKHGYNPIGSPDYNNNTNIAAIPGTVLAERLSRLMNTLWNPSLSLEFLTGNFPTNLSTVNGIESTLVTITDQEEVFTSSTLWFIFLLISTIVLFTIISIGVYLKYFATIAPDIIGHIGSLTRDNEHVNIPTGGSSLSGWKRARYLKNVEIKIGDANPMDQMGHIVIMSVDQALKKRSGRDLDRKRKYD